MLTCGCACAGPRGSASQLWPCCWSSACRPIRPPGRPRTILRRDCRLPSDSFPASAAAVLLPPRLVRSADLQPAPSSRAAWLRSLLLRACAFAAHRVALAASLMRLPPKHTHSAEPARAFAVQAQRRLARLGCRLFGALVRLHTSAAGWSGDAGRPGTGIRPLTPTAGANTRCGSARWPRARASDSCAHGSNSCLLSRSASPVGRSACRCGRPRSACWSAASRPRRGQRQVRTLPILPRCPQPPAVEPVPQPHALGPDLAPRILICHCARASDAPECQADGAVQHLAALVQPALPRCATHERAPSADCRSTSGGSAAAQGSLPIVAHAPLHVWQSSAHRDAAPCVQGPSPRTCRPLGRRSGSLTAARCWTAGAACPMWTHAVT